MGIRSSRRSSRERKFSRRLSSIRITTYGKAVSVVLLLVLVGLLELAGCHKVATLLLSLP